MHSSKLRKGGPPHTLNLARKLAHISLAEIKEKQLWSLDSPNKATKYLVIKKTFLSTHATHAIISKCTYANGSNPIIKT
jgi:hypothetical protein